MKYATQQRQGSCLGGLQSALVERESDMDCGGPSVDPELWCSCRGRDDGRLMICCDQQGENCNVWYHNDCLGLTMEEGRRIGASGEGLFVLPVALYRMIPMIHHLLWIPSAYLIHVPIFNGGG